MLMQIERALIQQEIIKLPVVYVRSEVERGVMNKIKEIVASRQGEITDDEEEATHIIHPTVDPHSEDYARPSFKKDRHIMLHWCYFPESYDSWIPNNFDLPVRKH